MKNLILILVVILASCSAKENDGGKKYSKNLVNDTVVSDKHEQQRGDKDKKTNDKVNFEVLKYKQGIDSLLIEIVGKESQTELLIDTLVAGDLVFIELKKTPLSNVIQETVSSVKYSFPLIKGDSRLKHHLVILTFPTLDKARSIFAVLEKVALEKSGVPGLTYTSDYLVQLDNSIYWVNSNCSYSHASHSKFVRILKGMIDTAGKEKITCECGKVLCATIKE